MLRRLTVVAALTALRIGIRFPDWPLLRRFRQQGRVRDLLDRLDVSVFVDVGASIGRYAQHTRMMGFKGEILSFEPVGASYRTLASLAARDPRWEAYDFALGKTTESRKFNIINRIGDQAVFSSFLPPLHEDADNVEIVKIRRLDDVLDEVLTPGDDHRIFLKMDTQGYDLEVMGGASRYLDRIVAIQSEVSVTPIYQGMPHFTTALKYYETLGYSLMDLFVVNRTGRGEILEYDCLMVNKHALAGSS